MKGYFSSFSYDLGYDNKLITTRYMASYGAKICKNTYICVCEIVFFYYVLVFAMAKTILKSDIELYVINRVREMRTSRGLSQADLAHLLNLSIGFVGHIENPRYRAKYNLNHLNELAKIFDCSLKDFLPETPF